MDDNAIVDLYLALVDEVLSSVAEKKSANEIWDTLIRLYVTPQKLPMKTQG